MTPLYWIWVNIIVTQCSTCVRKQNFAFRQWRTKVLRHFHEMAPFLHSRHLYPPNRFRRKFRNQCCKLNYNVYVVVQFYPWFKFYFPLVFTRYHPLTFLKTKFKSEKNWTTTSTVVYPFLKLHCRYFVTILTLNPWLYVLHLFQSSTDLDMKKKQNLTLSVAVLWSLEPVVWTVPPYHHVWLWAARI